MFHLSSMLHRHGAVLHANLSIENIRLGDILTHRYDLRKQIVAHIGQRHLLLVDGAGRITRIRKAKAVRTYCRRAFDTHGRRNVRTALLLATKAMVNDNRLLTLLGFRTAEESYLAQIEHDAV